MRIVAARIFPSLHRTAALQSRSSHDYRGASPLLAASPCLERAAALESCGPVRSRQPYSRSWIHHRNAWRTIHSRRPSTQFKVKPHLLLALRLWPRRTPQFVLQQKSPNHPKSFTNDFGGHLGIALKTVRKNDGHFNNSAAAPPNFVRHLHLKAVAVGANAIQVDLGQRRSAKTFVTAGWIGDRHAGDDLNVLRRAHAEHEPLERPI